MPASPSANSFTSSQLRLPYSTLFVVLMRTSRPRLAPGDTVVSVAVPPFVEVPQLELVRAVASPGPLIGDEERPRFVRHLELVRERGARQTAHDGDLIPDRCRDDVPLGRRLDRIRDAISVRVALGGPERQHRQRGTDEERGGTGRGGRKDNLP